MGIGLSKDIDSNMAMRAILYSHGASVQDEEGNVVINSKNTMAAVEYVTALYREAMTPEVLNWDSVANNIFMLNGNGSLVVNAISVNRTAEKKRELADISKNIWLAKAPGGPAARMGAAIDEIFITGVITTMFRKAATGELTAKEAVLQAEAACKGIFDKWKRKVII